MVVGKGNGVDLLRLTKSQEVASLSSSSFEEEEKEEEEKDDNEEVGVVRDEDAVGKEKEERCKGEIDPKGAHPILFLFSCYSDISMIILMICCFWHAKMQHFEGVMLGKLVENSQRAEKPQ